MQPIVAVVGRPNVGKSTLFNRIVGSRLSIVEDTPGVTRDRLYAETSWLNHKFTVIDTGGLDASSDEYIPQQILRQATLAIDTADVVAFVVDGKAGIVEGDLDAADILRRDPMAAEPFNLAKVDCAVAHVRMIRKVDESK